MPANGNLAEGKKSGIAYWMQQVLKEAAKAGQGFDPDAVHDLRVALRRCRSMGQVLLQVDPVPEWKKMRKEGKRVFSSLGDLRDCQVMMDWIKRLSEPGDPAGQKLLADATTREQMQKTAAGESLAKFDARAWEKWTAMLARRIRRFRPDSEIFQGIALERWEHARDLHRAAMHSRSKVAMHRLRIGVKKFRYVVENFLPRMHGQIGDEMKAVQDLLGEVHDLDVLWDTSVRIHAFETPEERLRWAERISEERRKQVENYKQRAQGAESIWRRWRGLLPDEERAERATMRRLQAWASVLDPDFAHTRRVSALAVQLYDGLTQAGVLPANGSVSRGWLLAAAVMHDVGKRKGDKGHQRRTQKKIQKLELPYGWNEEQRKMIGLIARYHRGDWSAVPRAELGGLRAASIRTAQKIGGVLRLANALDQTHEGAIQRIEVTRGETGITVLAEGLIDDSRLAEKIAAARHLLEVRCGMAILVRGS
ncbi:MAG TPA: CHAD domain-containing protein [Terriglobales bacterium]|nr:CHAD domain-containing protein [Terriglobales bacterium]